MRLHLNYDYTDSQVKKWIHNRIRIIFQINTMYYWVCGTHAISHNPDVAKVLGFLINNTKEQREIIWTYISGETKIALRDIRQRELLIMQDKMRAALILMKIYNRYKLRRICKHLTSYMPQDLALITVKLL